MPLPVTCSRTCPGTFQVRSSRSVGHVLTSYSRRSMAHANPVHLPPTPSESCEAISPYPFKPYKQAPLGTNSPSHHFTSLDFSLPPNQLPHALNRLEGATLRLISHYPFLTGNVISSRASGTNKAFEIQPVTASHMRHIPMLQTQHHAANSSRHPSHAFLPFPAVSLPDEPCPALRCKANVLGTKLQLVFGWDTRVTDPGGVFAVVRALAELCRDPGAVRGTLPVSNPWKQAQTPAQGRGKRDSGDLFSGLGLSSARHAHQWQATPRKWGGLAPAGVSSMSETRTARLNGDKIAMLTDACNLLVGRVAHDGCPGRLDQEDVVSAVVGVCGSRARSRDSHYGSDSPSAAATRADEGIISVATDLRHLSPLPSLTAYMGNATVSIPVPARVNSLPALDNFEIRSLLLDIAPQDLYQICNVAFRLRGRISAMEKGSEESNTQWNTDGEDGPGNSIHIHTLRPMNFYMNFGPLGRVCDVNVPGTQENGTCWVLPERERGGGWDVAVTIEQKAIEKLKADRLVTWVVDRGL